MTTPVEQNVPADFQNELDLPQSDIDPNAVAAAQGALNKAKLDSVTMNWKIGKTRTAVNTLKQQLKNKHLDPAYRKKLQGVLDQQQKALDAQIKARQDTVKSLGTLQNKVYEVSGQYDKLLKGENRDAFLALKSLFNQYGLGSLAGKIYDYVKQGYGADTISILLQDTKEYKTRFAANDARVKAGLSVLSPADYLATEASYRQILSSSGLPKGFYDNPADFQKWIANDVSPTEIKDRVDLAVSATSQANPAYKQALFNMYGINEADLTAYFLDSSRAEPILKKQAAAGAIGAAAIRRGFAANTLDLEGYATLGITADQAEEAYSNIADSFNTMLGLAGRYGDTWNQRLAEQEQFTPGAASSGGQESASNKGKRLRSQERALFSGTAKTSVQGLNAGYSQT